MSNYLELIEGFTIKVRVTKSLYKAFDSYERKQTRTLKELIKAFKTKKGLT